MADKHRMLVVYSLSLRHLVSAFCGWLDPSVISVVLDSGDI